MSLGGTSYSPVKTYIMDPEGKLSFNEDEDCDLLNHEHESSRHSQRRWKIYRGCAIHTLIVSFYLLLVSFVSPWAGQSQRCVKKLNGHCGYSEIFLEI